MATPITHRTRSDTHARAVQRSLEDFIRVFDKLVTDRFDHGSDAIGSGNTSVDVSHNLGTDQFHVFIMPTADPGATMWVSARDDTDFTVDIGSAPGSDLNFDWLTVKVV